MRAEGLIPPEPADANVTVLTTLGLLAVKRITPEAVVPYDNAKHFRVTPLRVETVEQMYRLLEFLGCCKHSFLLMETPRSSVENPRGLRRANFFNEDRFWFFLDIDHVEAPDGIDPTSPEAIAYVRGRLPEFLRDVECVAQFTSGAGRSGKEIRLHLAFKLDRPVRTEILSKWARSHNVEPGALQTDLALFRSVQAHYTGTPVFEGVEDPFEGRERVSLLHGERADVPADALIRAIMHQRDADHRSQEQAAEDVKGAPRCGWTGHPEDYLRDEPDGLGLHRALLQITWEAAQRLGPRPARAQVFKLARRIRSAAVANHAGGLLTGRSRQQRIEAETAPREVLRLIKGAIERGAALRTPDIPRQGFDHAMRSLRAAAKGKAPVPGFTIHDWAFAAALAGRGRIDVEFSIDELLIQLDQTAGTRVDRRIRHRLVSWRTRVIDNHDRVHGWGSHRVQQIRTLDEVEVRPGEIVAVKAPYGSGKTQRLARRGVRESEATIVLHHRISLTTANAERLMIASYRDQVKLSEDWAQLMGSDTAACIDSLATRKEVLDRLNRADLVIVDEASQVLRHLNSDITRERAQKILQALANRLRAPGVTLLLLDADLDGATVDRWREIAGDRPLMVYELRQARLGKVRLLRDCTRTKASSAIATEVDAALSNSERVVFACDSKAQVKALHERLRRTGYVGGCITSETAHNIREAFAADPDGFPKIERWQYLAYSPSIAAGVSMQSGYFGRVFGLYTGTVTPADFAQMLARVRTTSIWTVAISARAAGYTPAVKERSKSLLGLTGADRIDATSRFLLAIDAAERNDHQWYAQKFVHHLRSLGLTIESIGGDVDADLGRELDELRQELRGRQIQEILSARIIESDQEANRLRFTNDRNGSDQLALDRWRVCRFLQIEPSALSASDVEFMKLHRHARSTIELFAATRGRGMGLEWIRGPEPGALILRRHLRPTAEMFATLWRILKVDPVSGRGIWDKDAAAAACDALVREHADVLVTLGVPLRAASERPQERVRSLLARVGLQTENTGTRQMPAYRIERSSWDQILGYAARVAGPELMFEPDETRTMFDEFETSCESACEHRFDRWIEQALERHKVIVAHWPILMRATGCSRRTAFRRLDDLRNGAAGGLHVHHLTIDGRPLSVFSRYADPARAIAAVASLAGAGGVTQQVPKWSIAAGAYI